MNILINPAELEAYMLVNRGMILDTRKNVQQRLQEAGDYIIALAMRIERERNFK